MIQRREYPPVLFRLVALIGDGSIVPLLLYLCCPFLAGPYTLPITLLATPVLLGAGFLLQLLFIPRAVRASRTENFLPDDRRVYLPRRLPVLSYLLSAGVGLLLALPLIALLPTLYRGANQEIGPYLFIIPFIVAPLLGQTVAAMRAISFTYHVHLIEMAAVYIVYAALVPRAGLTDRLVYLACLAVFVMAYVFLYSQMGLARLSAMATTVHIDRRMILHRMLSALGLFAKSLSLFIGLLSAATTLYVLGLFGVVVLLSAGNRGQPTRSLYYILFSEFPSSYPPINLMLCITGAIVILAGWIYLIAKRSPSLRTWLKRLGDALYRLLFSRYVPKPPEERQEQHIEYTDTIRPAIAEKQPPRYPDRYAAICREIERLPGAREQIAFAYRVMVDRLIRARCGVDVTHTPHEIAAILVEGGVMEDGETLAEAFACAVYSPPGTEIPAAQQVLNRIMQVIRIYTEEGGR